MIDRTEEYKKIIQNGSIAEIQEFTKKSFHEIKHTESFTALLWRLKDTEWEVREVRKELENAKRLISMSIKKLEEMFTSKE